MAATTRDEAKSITVTPQMIVAGVAELAGFDWVECAADADDVVARIFRAMLVEARNPGTAGDVNLARQQ